MAKAPKAEAPAKTETANAVPSNPSENSVGVREASTTELTNGTTREDF